jgi:hypothetical protein
MKKLAKEWFAHLPEPIRSQAVANCRGLDVTYSTLSGCLFANFTWSKTPQCNDYWYDIYTRAEAGEFDQPEPNLHGWISVKDRLPTQGEAVLVIGDFNSELSGFLEKNQCGLVAWGSVEYSQCKDYCYFPQWYTNIKFWQPLPKLPEVKGGENV